MKEKWGRYSTSETGEALSGMERGLVRKKTKRRAGEIEQGKSRYSFNFSWGGTAIFALQSGEGRGGRKKREGVIEISSHPRKDQEEIARKSPKEGGRRTQGGKKED